MNQSGRTQTPPMRITTSTPRPRLIQCRLGLVQACLNRGSSSSLPKATRLPQKVTAPMSPARAVAIENCVQGARSRAAASAAVVRASPSPVRRAVSGLFQSSAAATKAEADRPAGTLRHSLADRFLEECGGDRDRHANGTEKHAPHGRPWAAHHFERHDEEHRGDQVGQVDPGLARHRGLLARGCGGVDLLLLGTEHLQHAVGDDEAAHYVHHRQHDGCQAEQRAGDRGQRSRGYDRPHGCDARDGV